MRKLFVTAVAVFALAGAAFARVNVNSATVAELEALKDIGPVKAKAIVEYRKKHGAFKSVEELTKVPGIGATTLAKIKGELSVSDSLKPDAAKGGAPADKKPVAAAAGPAKTTAKPAGATTVPKQ